MMKQNKIVLLVFVIINLCLLSSCGDWHNENDTMTVSTDESKGIGKLDNYSPIVLNDESIIYNYFLDNTVFAIGKYDRHSEKKISIGTQDDFSISYGIPALIDNIAYLPVTLTNGEHNLLSIDVKNNNINIIFTDYSSEPLDLISTMSNEIYTLSSNLDDNDIYSSFIRKYNVDTQEMDVCILKESISKNNGKIIKGFACSDGMIYTLTEQKDGKNSDIFVDVYDGEKYNLLNTLHFDNSIKSSLLNNNIAQFYSFGDYFYIRDYSDYGLICKTDGNSISLIWGLPQLRIAYNNKNVKDEYYVFFIRESNEFYIFEVNSGSLLKATLQLSENESIRNAISDGDNLCISVLDESVTDSYVTKETYICSYKYLLGISKNFLP